MRYSIIKSYATNMYYVIDNYERIVISEHKLKRDAQKTADKLNEE